MSNYNFHADILQHDAEYWVVAKCNKNYSYGREELMKDDILFIVLPPQLKLGQQRSNITYAELQDMQNMEVSNVYFTGNYTPFQSAQNFYNFYRGFPVKTHIREFFIAALLLNGNEIHEYEELYKKIAEPTEEPPAL